MAARPARRADGWSDPGLARVAAWLGETAGLTFPDNRGPGVEDALRTVMSELRVADAHTLLALLRRSPEARERALDVVTIGETYFFRDPTQLALVERLVLPTLARRPGGPARLRMWSAGCASGEEPYTLSMLVREAGWAPGADVLGTDVAVARLATARRGRYGKWSMRGMSPERLARWFEPQGRSYVIDPDVRRDTAFRVLNLADPTWPSAESGVWGMDVILCRNVLIYFDRETIAGVAQRLLAALGPDGWLLIGASDPPLDDFVPCEVVATRAGLLYRPRGACPVVEAPGASSLLVPLAPSFGRAAPPRPAFPAPLLPPMPPMPPVPPVSPPSAPATVASPAPVARDSSAAATTAATPVPEPPAALAARARAAYAVADYGAAADAARMAVDAGTDDAATAALLVRALANLGRLHEAGAACADVLARHPMEPELLLLHATLLLADGRAADAAGAARRALYLDRAAPMSHLLLGDALARAGDAVGAVRAFRAAERLLVELPAEQVVPHADGETAGRLLRAARYRIAAPAGGTPAGGTPADAAAVTPGLRLESR